MLEGLAAWVLNTYVGEYVENLNTDQLSIALLQGAVELENLPLKKDALKHLDLPIEVKSGFIGKITLQIPLSRLRSEPWAISIEKLYLVAGPLTEVKYDGADEAATEESTKAAMLDALEAKWQVHRQGRQSEAPSTSWFSYGASMAANILENIQLHVTDVHIRYEDEYLNPTSPFACGVTIKNLSAQSTDINWISKFVSSSESDTMFKLADLKGFSIYCDMHAAMLGDLPMGELADALMREIYVSTNDGNFHDHDYILNPVSAQAKIKRRTTTLPLRSPATPRISMDISLDDIAFKLSTEQYQSLLLWQSEFERHGLRRQHRKHKPPVSVSKSPRSWWQFAITCHLSKIQDRNKRHTFSFVLERARTAVEYTKAYNLDLTEDSPAPTVKETLKKIEEELGFDELKILREVVLAKLKSENRLPTVSKSATTVDQATPNAGSGDQKGLFQSWFPGWSGWYQKESVVEEENPGQESDVDTPADAMDQSELEQEILDVIHDSTENSSLLRKDTVFARMTFALSKGSFELLESKGAHKDPSSVAELQCATIGMEFESRPRTSAMKFKLAVGGLHLQDKTTHNSVFPYIISPQSQDSLGHSTSPMPRSSVSERLSPRTALQDSGEWKFFELSYEKNPPSSFFRYRACIKTRPLDIVYSPAFIKQIKGFFSSPVSRAQKARKSRASAWKFEALKKKSPEQLMETLDQLLEAEGVKTRWDVKLDISAPKLIIPERYIDPTSPMVVIDLGRLCLETCSSRTESKTSLASEKTEDNDDDFHTPLSTPPNEKKLSSLMDRSSSSCSLQTVRDTSATSLTGLSSAAVVEHLYERYKLDLTDMQVLLGRPQDNWRHAYTRGNSRMHILDKFTISLQLERRLIVTADPQWPKMKLSGMLPSLTFHLNERKIQAMNTSMDILSQKHTSTSSLQSAVDAASLSSVDSDPNMAHHATVEVAVKKGKEEIDNKLVVLQFLINKLSVEIQSQGQALAEFRVTDVQADVSKKSQTTSLKLTVHSLLVVDALQSYGTDFELLIASHKHLVLDSRSGSIRGSDAGSPLSPASPISPGSPGAEDCTSPLSSGHFQAGSFQAIQEAITSAFSVFTGPNVSDTQPGEGEGGHTSPLGSVGGQTEALIIMEYEQIQDTGVDGDKTGDMMQILNLQFNSLDFIANQETIVEILSFFKRAFPSPSSHKLPRPSKEKQLTRQETIIQPKKDKLMVTADFKRLNILLPRFSEKDGRKLGKKVATATMSTSKIEACLDDCWQIEGSLGGLHLTDVTPEGSLYQQVFSVGENQIDQTDGLISPETIPSAMYRTAKDDNLFASTFQQGGAKKALSFTVKKTIHDGGREGSFGQALPECDEIFADFSMASVYYTHSPQFLNELMECMSEFQDYMSGFVSSIGKAATEVAMGLVAGRVDRESHDLSTNAFNRDISLSDLTDTVLLDNTFGSVTDLSVPRSSCLQFTARMETPIIALPRTPTSYQVLLAHLGEITISNSSLTDSSTASTVRDSLDQREEVSISLRNMNLYSLDLDKHNTQLGQNLSATLMGKSYYSLSYELGVPILYDTAVDLVIAKETIDVPIINPEVTTNFPPHTPQKDVSTPQSSSVLNVSAKITPAVKLVLSKEVYEQILQTLDNLTYSEEDFEQDPTASASDTTSGSATSAPSSESLPGESQFSINMQESAIQEGFLAKHFHFEVPLFEVELRGNFGEGEQGLVDLKLHDFSMQYAKDNKVATQMKLRLRSLSMDDLLEGENSSHRQIMISRSSQKQEEKDPKPKAFLSTSCPDSTIIAPTPMMPASLPSSFHEQIQAPIQHIPTTNFFIGLTQPHRTKKGTNRERFPQTPPPSPSLRECLTPEEAPIEDLVHIDVVLVDKKSPEYVTKYNKTNRFIDVNFSCLETTFNLQTWVVLLDFLGMGAKVHDTESDSTLNDPSADKSESSLMAEIDEIVNQEINFNVESFTLVLNKPEYELAQASMTNLQSHISKRDFNMTFKGQLGSLSLTDHSPHGELYPQKFVTIGRHALEFDFFKFGFPDEQLQREYDLSLKLRMSSVRYIHTNRFQSEILAFCQHFLQLQDVLGRMRAASAGQKISENASRGSRIKLDIEAGSPILLIPHSSKTDDILIADLGILRLVNQFIVDGQEGTSSHKTISKEDPFKSKSDTDAQTKRKGFQEGVVHRAMTDSMFNQHFPPQASSDPMSQSIYGSLDYDLRDTEPAALDERVYLVHDVADIKSPEKEGTSVDPIAAGAAASASIKRPYSDTQLNITQKQNAKSAPHSPTDNHKCLLDVWSLSLTDMDLFTARRVSKRDYHADNLVRDMEFSSCVIQIESGNILREKCQLELHVERNLESDLSHSAPDWQVNGRLSSMYCHLDLAQYKLIRGILGHNLGEKVEQFRSPLMTHLQDPKIQTVLSGDVYKCISMIVDLHNVSVELLMTHSQGPDNPEVSLAKMDFIHSQLSYESFSDQTKDIDLVSHEIVVVDSRFKTQPMNARPNVFVSVLQPSAERWSKDGLQMELHYRSSPIGTQFTILLNNMKLMCIFDWLLSVQEFLLTDAENPFKEEPQVELKAEACGGAKRKGIGRTTSPLTVSRGIMTKRGPFVEEVNVPFELKLNITDTQFIVVEDSTTIDTNAVILKTTAVLMYKPQAHDKVMRCSLQSIEVFSCCLMSEEDTALSIVDPMSISIELNANPLPDLRPTPSGGLLDVKEADQRQLLLEVNFNTMTIRVSYHDMMLFLSILNALPQQALQAKQRHSQYAGTTLQQEESLKKLGELGFSRKDCEKALSECGGKVDDAAIWLTRHATPLPTPSNKQNFAITSAELKASSVCLCVIDDCGDADVPLAEISFSAIQFNQTMEPNIEGKAIFQMTGEYYNRNLSGWEPFLETWRCFAEWKQFKEPQEKMSFQISSSEVINLNLTSTLLEQYNMTKGSWTANYMGDNKESTKFYQKDQYCTDPTKSSKALRRRMPFMPYTIRNDTGCDLWYITAISSPANEPKEGMNDTGHGQSYDNAYIQASDWKRVVPGESKPFLFHRREKLRHKKTHGMHVNQLLVTVCGWGRLSPISVDKVGVYFREGEPDSKTPTPSMLYPARIVIEIKQDGSARKLIVVRSSLVVLNQLDCPMQFKMTSTNETGSKVMTLRPNIPATVPLPQVNHMLYARPQEWPMQYCDRPLHWMHVTKAGETSDGFRECKSQNGDGEVYRFCVSVRRELYPEDPKTGNAPPLPGHTITLVPPVTITNLLPLEMHYYLKKTNISGNLKPGKSAALHGVDLRRDLYLGVHLENLPACRELTIPPSTTKYKVKLRVYDDKNRLLELTLRIKSSKGGSLRLSLQSRFWLVNKSGLPLIFRQDGARQEAAGQLAEHEIARSVTPLLFSFSEKEAPYLCTMRVGKNVHGEDAAPQWCKRFSLDRGSGMRQLHVVPRTSNKPDWVYNIGIEVSPGKGSYRDTTIITFAPRNVLDNQSQHTLAIVQRYYTESKTNAGDCLTALPNCKLPFHWPRQDLDQLLCVKILDKDGCNWSGGFRIDRVNSFHINMRDEHQNCVLLKVEIVLQGPTFFIMFADADVMPPPFRLDNLSMVPVYFHQAKTVPEKFRKLLQPSSTVAYAWDEPTLEPMLTLQIHGGQSGEYNMNNLEEEHQLCYENFIYLAVTQSFNRNWDGPTMQLVIDCVHSNNLVFKRMENGKRSQLWRMTSSGMLEHEGSMPPRDPHKKVSPPPAGLVLDIGDIAPQPGRCVPLVLKKPDERRKSTQTWRFTEDGRLCCSAGTLCVQSIDGKRGLQDGAIAVLGPWQAKPEETLPPAHMLISRHKLRPGSGILAVRVTMEGPIRVLQITDRQALSKRSVGDWEVYDHQSPDKKSPCKHVTTTPAATKNMEVILNLKGGLGISLVNSVPEELIYISLTNITVEMASRSDLMTIDFSVAEVQIDNQFLGAQRRVMMFVTPVSRKDVPDNTPALHITAHKVPSGQWNADIFKHLYISTKRMTVHLEERLLWKLTQMFGYNKLEDDIQRMEESYDTHRTLSAASSIQAKRYYFSALKLNISRITLSMVTTSKLPADLKAVKNANSMTLVAFEDAKVDLDPFVRNHPFETSAFLLNEMVTHYTEELRSQAAKILGSVDFLGNPLGLFNDVTEGISGLIKDGNVGGLFKNVAHGVSNSAAKVAGSVSDGFGTLSMDEEHNETRNQIREQSTSSSDHLIAGVKGLGYGILGGLTSVIKQPFEGARADGVEGFFKGVGKGVIGTVVKPVAGVFDLTSGVANAVRDTSKSSSRQLPSKVRPPRSCHGPGGLLPPYSIHQSEAQRLLFNLNDNDYTEFPIALEDAQVKDGMRVLITSKQLFFLKKQSGGDMETILNIQHKELRSCRPMGPGGKKNYIELTINGDGGLPDSLKKPQIRCERYSVAQKIINEINYARGLYEEVEHTLQPLPNTEDLDT